MSADFILSDTYWPQDYPYWVNSSYPYWPAYGALVDLIDVAITFAAVTKLSIAASAVTNLSVSATAVTKLSIATVTRT